MKYLCQTIIVLIASCQSKTANTETTTYQDPAHHISALSDVFEAHGGYENWSRMNSLSYQKGEESTITDLKSRMIRVKSPERTIGFDGTDVWVTPDTVDASGARFRHNLYFYFYAMPFVVGDPGAYYEQLEQRELAGSVYDQIKVSYKENVGDAPDDN